jgi:UDP-3-O-[3-hydroxymyristoyl] glucosamine N-acyltransferase
MKFPVPVSLEKIATLIGAKVIGDAAAMATGINELHKVEKGDLVFVDHPKYYDKCLQSDASFIIINKEVELPAGKALLLVEQPFEAYLSIVKHYRPFMPSTESIQPTSTIGEGSYVAPNVYIGHYVSIGKDCIIQPNVTIMDHCIIGDRVVIQSGTVIGSDAFYYNSKKDRAVWYKRMESCGRVIVEDDVEIGAGCTIDRGVTHDTILGAGSKFDNQVHIGHDTVVGKNCLMAAQVGVAGAVHIGDGAIFWGQVGVNKTISIGNNAVVMGQSGVVASLEPGKVYMGTPAEDASIKRREFVWVRRIPELWKKVMQP